MLIPYTSILTRENQVCRICFNAGVRPSVPLVPFIENLGLLRNHRGSFVSKRKAALRRHVAESHPGWMTRINWTKA